MDEELMIKCQRLAEELESERQGASHWCQRVELLQRQVGMVFRRAEVAMDRSDVDDDTLWRITAELEQKGGVTT